MLRLPLGRCGLSGVTEAVAHRSIFARLVARLEIPDCGCRADPLPCGCDGPCDCPVLLPPPCEHIRRAAHQLPLPEWAELLELLWPNDYTEPPPPAVSALVISREARVALLAGRHDRGEGLYHPLDLIQVETDLRIGDQLGWSRNGRHPSLGAVAANRSDFVPLGPAKTEAEEDETV